MCSTLQKTGHQGNQIARSVAAVELMGQDAVPGVFAGTGGAGQGEQHGAFGKTGTGPRGQSGGANGFIAQHVHEDGKPFDFLVIERGDGFDGDIATGETGAARGDDDISALVVNMIFNRDLNGVLIVCDDLARDAFVPGFTQHFFQPVARAVIFRRARV